jgi:hypothetical protein
LLWDIVVSIEEETYAMVEDSDADIVLIELFAKTILPETVSMPLFIEFESEEETVFIVEYTDEDIVVNELLSVSIVAAADAELLLMDAFTVVRLSAIDMAIEDELEASS